MPGQIEKETRARVLALLSQRLGQTYLSDWIDRPAKSLTFMPPAAIKLGDCLAPASVSWASADD
jgi:hypothetical protein